MESLLQPPIQAITNFKLVRTGPALIPEPSDIHHENGPVYWHLRTFHLTSYGGDGEETILG